MIPLASKARTKANMDNKKGIREYGSLLRELNKGFLLFLAKTRLPRTNNRRSRAADKETSHIGNLIQEEMAINTMHKSKIEKEDIKRKRSFISIGSLSF